MTKKIIFAVATMIALALALISAGFYLQDAINKKEQEIKNLYARREDLSLEQQRIERFLNDLNQAIIEIRNNQQEITNKIENSESSVSPPSPQPAPEPSPQPNPPPVTSAS